MPKQPVRPEPIADQPTEEVGSVQPAVVDGAPDEAQTSELAIITSKIELPRRSDRVLTRTRLVGWLQQQRRARVTLISAEAGYGKSTLLNDFSARTDESCLWYRLETSDSDWITFLSHLVASVRHAFPGFGEPTEALLRHVAAMGPSREVVLATFLSDLSTLGSAETALILDDYHLVDGAPDVDMIMGRLLERAPSSMRFVMASRGRPGLALGRLTAQGRVSELSTSDLRFTRSEIEELFGSTYQQPLERATCDIVEERTEGWAASLQLVSASIATSRPSEVGQFIDALSGATGPIFDFLAEEVLSRLAPEAQRVLLHASSIDRVTPELVAAALSATSEPVAVDDVSASLASVEALGLVGPQGDGEDGVRIHPLLRQFLEHQLAHASTPAELRSMHLAIALQAEATDWLAAGKHFVAADHEDEAMRVLGAAASQALGTGQWGGAAEVIASMPDTTPPPAVEVIRARALIDSGHHDEALELLDSVSFDDLGAVDEALVGLTQAAALHARGDSDLLVDRVSAVVNSPSTPSPLREVAVAWQQMLAANEGGSIAAAGQALAALEVDLQHAGLHYYAGVTLHNLANTHLAGGRYQAARDVARQAVRQINKSGDAGGILSSTNLIVASAVAESGKLDVAASLAIDSVSAPTATADALAEAAWICAVVGRMSDARSLLARLDRGDSRGSQELAARAQACFARIAYHQSRGEFDQALEALAALSGIRAPDIDGSSRGAVIAAAMEVTLSGPRQVQRVTEALSRTSLQGAWRWMARARILQSVMQRDGDSLATWIRDAFKDSRLAVLEMVNVVAGAIDLLADHADLVEECVLQAPTCWVPALSRQALRGGSGATAAAAVVSRYGSIADAPVLRKFDRAVGPRATKQGLAKKLIKRVSPTVIVHDLGPSSYQVGDRHVVLSEVRRKSASLLLFLVTRPGLAATREQAMESLWPDQTPKSGLNSLHQTLFFLRRDIEPWHEEGSTAEYVRMESDLVYLDPELFQIDSVAFARQCADIMSSGTALSRGPELLRLYQGRFAPEFEYEEWAEDWRTQLHASFLHLAQTTCAELIVEGRQDLAVDVLTAATAIDMLAYELRSMLIASLAAVGSADAARAHYENLASLHLRDLGVEARSYEDIVTGRPP